MIEIADIYNIFSELNCPFCKEKLSSDDFKIVRDENDGLFVTQIRCQKCSKSFAFGLFGLGDFDIKNLKIKKKEFPAINYDDVIDAHKFCQNFDKNWHDYIKNKNLQ